MRAKVYSHKRGIRRTIQRVTTQQRNRLENILHYQSGSEWKSFQTDKAVENRRRDIAKAIPPADFVHGILPIPKSIFDD